MFWQLILFLGFLDLAFCQTKVVKSEDGMSGTISFSTPDLNDEEGHSPFVPDHLKCDSCKAVSFQLWNTLDSYNKLHKYLKYNLKESDILDITDDLCENTELWNGYGIKEIDGRHTLSGQGLASSDKPGVIAGGGKWPGRLRDMCEDFMGRIGEEKIYAVYKKEPGSRTRLENFLCRGPANTVRGECTKVKEHIYDGPGPLYGGEKPHYKGDDDEDDDVDVRDEL